MNCTKCNGSGSEGYISSFRCDRCGGTGNEPVALVERGVTALVERDTTRALSKPYHFNENHFRDKLKRLKERRSKTDKKMMDMMEGVLFGALCYLSGSLGRTLGLGKNPFDKDK